MGEAYLGTKINNRSVGIKGAKMLNKVPEITIFFWIIKVLCTTVGETASDFLNVNLGFGLTGTSIVMGILLLVLMFFQFKSKKYVPVVYWLTVVFISIFGTLVTDNMTDAMGVPLEVSTIVFTIALALSFIIWYASEKTLSIHSIYTTRREFFYWLTILFTFALGTAAGDLMAESLGLGYLVTGIIVCAVIFTVSVAWKLGLDSVLGFWIVYIMTRPLGASLGDYLSQPQKYGGLGLGATVTSIIFISAILLTIVFLSISKIDLKRKVAEKTKPERRRFAVSFQVIAVILILMVVSVSGYLWRHNVIMNEANSSVALAQPQDTEGTSDTASQDPQGNTSGSDGQAPVQNTAGSASSPQATAAANVSALGDLSSFITIEEDTLNLVNKGDMPAAASRVDDLEYTWDNAEARLKPMDASKWTEIDKTIDKVLRQLRSVNPDAAACKTALESSLATLQ